MGLLIPCAVEVRDLDAIFAKKVPKVKDNQREKWFVGTIGGSNGEHQPALEIYQDHDAEPPQADAQLGLSNGGVGVRINAHKFTCNK